MAESKGFYRSIISKWCRQCDFIADVNRFIERPGRKINTFGVDKCKMRDSVPAEYWYAVVKASELRGFGITFEMLGLHAWNKKLAVSA